MKPSSLIRKTGLKARKPWRPKRKPVRRRNPERAAAALLSDYGPPERREWFTSQPCAFCQREDDTIVQAHVRGKGRPGCEREIVPACFRCHLLMHEGIESFAAGQEVTVEGLLELSERYARDWGVNPEGENVHRNPPQASSTRR